MDQISFSIVRSEESFRRLCKVQQLLFYSRQRAMSLLSGSAVVLLSLAVKNVTISLIILFLGCWFIAGAETPPMVKARNMYRQLNLAAQRVDYVFYPRSFTVKTAVGGSEHSYDEVAFIIEDSRYLYLFRKDESGFMFEKSSAKGSDSEAPAKFFMQKCRAEYLHYSELRSLKYLFAAMRGIR